MSDGEIAPEIQAMIRNPSPEALALLRDPVFVQKGKAIVQGQASPEDVSELLEMARKAGFDL